MWNTRGHTSRSTGQRCCGHKPRGQDLGEDMAPRPNAFTCSLGSSGTQAGTGRREGWARGVRSGNQTGHHKGSPLELRYCSDIRRPQCDLLTQEPSRYKRQVARVCGLTEKLDQERWGPHCWHCCSSSLSSLQRSLSSDTWPIPGPWPKPCCPPSSLFVVWGAHIPAVFLNWTPNHPRTTHPSPPPSTLPSSTATFKRRLVVP